MKLLRAIKSIVPRVELRVNPHLSTDLRDPLRVHKMRRMRECRKVPVAGPFMPELPGMMRRQAD